MLNRREFLGASASLLALAAHSAAAEKPWAQSSDKKIRIGVVGGRFGLSWHWHEHPNCEVYAVSDLLPDRREQLVGKYQCDNAYESLEKLVLDPKVDAVAVFTGAPDHARHVEICMNHGKHVISACPACMTLEEAAAMKEIKERTGLKYMNAETSWYRWETQLAREAHAEGRFGDLLYCEAEYYHPKIGRDGDSLSYHNGERTWRYGFPPMLYPTHSTAFLVGVTGERLTHVSCIGQGDPDEPSLKDNQYDNPFLNGIGLFETDRGNPFRCNVAWNLHAHGERAQWFGTQAALYMDGPGGQPFSLREEGRNNNEKPDYWHRLPEAMRYDSGHGASHPFISNEFITALVEDREPTIDIYESLALCVPGIVAHESSLKGGERLAIPSFDKA
jgi:predicted dehydrogenase